MPVAVSTCLETPKNGQIPKKRATIKLLIKIALSTINRYSVMRLLLLAGDKRVDPGQQQAAGDKGHRGSNQQFCPQVFREKSKPLKPEIGRLQQRTGSHQFPDGA